MKAWIFDVDGVIANPETKTPNPEILTHLEHILTTEDILSINTGRSVSWLQDNLFSKLNLTDKTSTLFFSCEQGGVWGFVKSSEVKTFVDNNQIISPELQEKVKELVKPYTTLFYDDSKKTMISLEMNDGTDLQEFEKEKEKLTPILQTLIDEHGGQYVVSPSIIALDLQKRFEGKDQGVTRILSMWAERNLNPDEVITVGDSPSDILMAEELHLAHFNVEFVYVGDKDLEGNKDISVVKTREKFEKGTLEYLANHL